MAWLGKLTALWQLLLATPRHLNRSLDFPSVVDYKTLWRTNDANNGNEATLNISSLR